MPAAVNGASASNFAVRARNRENPGLLSSVSGLTFVRSSSASWASPRAASLSLAILAAAL